MELTWQQQMLLGVERWARRVAEERRKAAGAEEAA
jgi:hypothetical protein